MRLVRDETGDPIEIVGYWIDITDRKQVEQERERFLAVCSDLQVIVGADGYFTWVSPTFESILGWTTAEMIASPWADFVHPEYVAASVSEVENLFSGYESFQFENRFRHKDGSYHWLRWNAKRDPDEQQIYAAAIDVTIEKQEELERQRAEQKVQEQAALLDIATDAIYVCGLDLVIRYWNQGAERLYGWLSDEVIGQEIGTVLNQVDLDLMHLMQASLELHGAWQGEVQEQSKTNQPIVVEMRCTLVRDEAGQPKAILVVSTDVTEKKQLEAQFLRAQRLESLGTLASGIAHDLNNVLTPIIGIVQLLPIKLPNLDDRTQRLLEILNDSTQRGADLVNQILSFTRGVEGKPTNTQVSHLLAEIQKIMQQTFPKNIDRIMDIPKDLWLIAADATLLHQVFMNLCVNARDAMPNGGQLYIKAENLEVDQNYARMNLDAQVGSYVVVTIEDTGIGIPAVILDRIFDPFFTTKEVGKGTGLGLSTVIGIIKTHRGFVNVYSEVGQGRANAHGS